MSGGACILPEVTTILQNRPAFLRRLTAGGSFTDDQAVALADALDGDLKEPASRAQVTEVEAKLSIEIAKVRSDLTVEIASVRTEIAALGEWMERNFNRMLVVMIALVGVALAFLRLVN